MQHDVMVIQELQRAAVVECLVNSPLTTTSHTQEQEMQTGN